MRLSALIGYLLELQEEVEPFDTEVRVILSGVPDSACQANISGVELDCNGDVYMDLEEV